MIPDIKKILYATDLSDNSAYALRYAINSALKHDAGIIILHVFELESATSRSVLNLYLDEDLRNKIFNERVSDTIDRIRKRLKIS
jgi:nucleotide-binding universal stress UspA family protein